jgi:outer membrane protein OmpA-like peptidoglycan-associated protein
MGLLLQYRSTLGRGLSLAYKVVFICWCSIFLLISCASRKSLIVLLPDDDGQVGEIVVENKGGTQVLTEPRHATEVKAADVSPTAPVTMREEEVLRIFGEALAALPEPPIRFLLYFITGTPELTAESKGQIPEILRAIEARKSTDIAIVGHTDRVGSRAKNQTLGLKRAVSIKNILVSDGVDPSGIEVVSHGEDDPLIETEDNVAEPRNRRVEITIR